MTNGAGSLPPLSIDFEIDDKGSLVVKQIAGSLSKLGNNLDTSKRKMTSFETRMRKSREVLGKLKQSVFSLRTAFLALGSSVILRRGINELFEFQSAIVDMGRVTDREFSKIKTDILSIDASLGDPTALTQSYYQAISAGVTDTAEALELVEIAAMASNAAHLDTATTIKALTKLMAGFAGEIGSAAEASDLLFIIEKKGQTSFAEMAGVIGTVAAASKNLNISSREMAASLAQITQTAGSTEEAATQYAAVLTNLTKPTKDLIKVLGVLGVQNAETIISERGFIQTLQDIIEKTDGSSVALGKLFGSVRAISGIAALSSREWSGVTNNLREMEDITGTTQKSFDDFKNSLQGKWDAIQNEVQKTTVLFTVLAETSFGELLDELRNVAKEVQAWVVVNDKLIASNLKDTLDSTVNTIQFLVKNIDLLKFALSSL